MLRKMVMVSLFISIVPTVILGIGTYFYSSKVLQSEVNKANDQFLHNAADNIDVKLQNIRMNLVQLLNNPYFISDYRKDLVEDELGFFNKMYQILGAFQNSNNDILDLSLYLPHIAFVSPSYGTIRPDWLNWRAQLDEEMEKGYTMSWKDSLVAIKTFQTASDGITLIYKFPMGSIHPEGIVLAGIDAGLFKETIGHSTVYKGQFLFVVSDTGRLITSTAKKALPEEFYRQVMAEGNAELNYRFAWQGESYLVSGISSPYNHYKYMNLIPLRELNAKSRGIELMTLGLIFVFLLAGICAATITSRRMYRPIERLITFVKGEQDTELEADEMGFVQKKWSELKDTSRALELKLMNQLPLVRESFVLQMLQGHFLCYTEGQIDGLLTRYDLPGQGRFCVAITAFDRSFRQEGKFGDNDKDLIIFSIKNILDELLADSGFKGLTVNPLNDSIVVCVWDLSAAGGEEAWMDAVKAFAEHIRGIISGYLLLPVTIGLSSCARQMKEYPVLYRQALYALDSRIIAGRNQVLQETSRMVNSNIYPMELEQHFESSLKLGDQEEAERMLLEFAGHVRKLVSTPDGVLMYYNQLLAATLRTAYLLNVDIAGIFGETEPYSYIRMLNSIDDINQWFIQDLIVPIVTAVQENRRAEYEQMVEMAEAHIQTNYHRDISLEDCAEHCGVSTFQLSKWFKRLKKKSFIDYLTEYRIAKAKQYLLETDVPVGDISDLVGYQRQNFMRVFKKLEGVTPGQFRAARHEPKP